MARRVVRCVATAGMTLFIILRPLSVDADTRPFFGIVAGISTLSADARTVVNPSTLATALYDPENGAGIEAYLGAHVTEYLSAQLEYSWERNDIRVSGLQATVPPGDQLGAVLFYQQPRSSSQQTLIANVLLYFRDRQSWARPYLSAGAGLATFTSTSQASATSRADALAPPPRISSSAPAFEVAVGIDLRLLHNWGFRYSFAETIRSNPIDEQLSPPGIRPLATFRNLFGFIKQF